MHGGIIATPYLLRLFRLSRVYGGFIFCVGFERARAAVFRRQFSFASGVGSLCGGFAKLPTF